MVRFRETKQQHVGTNVMCKEVVQQADLQILSIPSEKFRRDFTDWRANVQMLLPNTSSKLSLKDQLTNYLIHQLSK